MAASREHEHEADTDDDRALPAGTLTFVFTDIEGSSEAWARRPLTMGDSLAMHNEILLGAAARHCGHVLKNLGDGYCFVFTAASDAIAMAVEAQRSLQAAKWADDERLLVRIGAHTGEATPTNHDYFGDTINRAARVMDAANGDQILVSDATRGVVAASERSANWSMSLCGDFELRGIGATTLHRVDSVDTIDDPRPVRARPVGVQKLPRNAKSFVGRASDLDRLVDQAGSHRLLTLVGVGGIGKSRLAIELAHRLAPNHDDGVYWCALAPISDPNDVVAAINSVVGVTPRPDRSLSESLAAALNDRKVLLIIDNCEHVAAAAASVIDELLDNTTGPAVVATSRTALQLRDEVVWPVSPLRSADDQVALFVDRARERNESYDPSPQDRAVIGEICAALDGLPLAIELAAARARIMQPADILSRLGDRFAVLGVRPETNERLRDIVRWSYQRLDLVESAVFRALSVFAGGFTLDAALAVMRASGIDELDGLDALQTLVDDALLQRTGSQSNRFLMLETLRQFGNEELVSEAEADTVQTAFLEWITAETTAAAALINTPREFDGFDALDRERDNLREAVVLLTSTSRFQQAADLVGPLFYYATLTVQFEICAWAHELSDRADLHDHPLFGDLCATASYGAYGQADTGPALMLARRGLGADPSSGPCWILGTMSAIAQADIATLLELFDELLPMLDSFAPPVQFWIRAWQALLDEWIAADGDAPAWADAAQVAAEACNGTTALAGASWVHGVVQASRDPARSAEHYQRALDMLGERAQRNLVAQTASEGLMALLSQHGATGEAVAACRDNLQSVLDNDWIAVVFEILPPVVTLIRADEPALAAQLVACAEANDIHIRGRTYKALSEVDDAIVAEARREAVGLSVRQVLTRIVAALTRWQASHG